MKSITNEVLLEKLRGLENLIDERFKENTKTNNALLVQVTKTNGTVNYHDRWIQRSQGIATVVSGVLIPIILYLLYLHIK